MFYTLYPKLRKNLLRSAHSSFLLFPIKKENRQRLYNLLSIFILKLILPRNIFLVDIVKKEQGCPVLGAFPCSLSLFIFPTNFYRHPPVKICYLLNAFFSNLSTSFSIHPSSKGLFNPASTITLVKKSRAERLQSL